MRAVLLFWIAVALSAQAPHDPTDVLTHARDKIIDRTNRASNYTCVLTVTHKYFKRTQAEKPPACDQLIGEAKHGNVFGTLEGTDRVRLDVKVSDGIEIGSWVGASEFDSRSILDLARGTFEGGTLGPILQDIFQNEATEFQYVDEKRTGTSSELGYTFQVPEASSHYFVRAEGVWFNQVAYRGSLWIDVESFDLKRLMVRTDDLPPEAKTCLATTTADYQRQPIGNGNFLMPRESVFQTLLMDSSAIETTLIYSGCREYGSESTIEFGGGTSTRTGDSQTSTVRPPPLPAGLAFSVILTDPIDTDTAAAGDTISAAVSRPAVDPRTKRVVIPGGTTVRGRIVRMEHFPRSHFLIAIQLETLKTGGAAAPIYAKPDDTRAAHPGQTEAAELTRPGTHIMLPPVGASRGVASFVFRTPGDRYVVSAGHESDWVTTSPAIEPAGRQ